MSLRSRTLITTTVAGLSAAVALSASTASATVSARSAPPDARKLDSSVLAPFQVAVRGGTVWWTDGFKGTITRLRNGHEKVISHAGAEGVAVSGNKLAYTSTPEKSFSRLVVRRPGHKTMVVNLRRFEATHNPDGKVHYGIIRHYSQCAADFFNSQQPGIARYTGIVDSHPYQVEALPRGAWAIAEAAGNEILRVSRTGHISVISLLPRQPVTITQSMADALHAPSCVVGVTYAFEPVPTDVERDGRGNLWVSVLPGGPEDPSLGARGAVYKITKHGRVIRIHGGFSGATNLAVWHGKVYVAELFGGRVSTIRHGKIVTVRSLPRPVAVEATRHKLFVGQLGDIDENTGQVNGPGAILRFPR